MSQLKINRENPQLSSRRMPPDRLPVPHPTLPGVMSLRLTQGKVALIDAADAAAVAQHTWCATKGNKSGTIFYAAANVAGRVVYLHRFLWEKWGRPPCRLIDHRDLDSLNYRRENLRPCSRSQNAANAGPHRDRASGLKGTRLLPNGRWAAQISVNRKPRHIGVFDTVEEANRAYLAEATAAQGEFARSA